MTLNALQQELIKEIKLLVGDMQFVGADGEPKEMKGFAQALPAEEFVGGRVTNRNLIFPYFVVQALYANYHENESAETEIAIVVGICDKDKEMRGYYTLIACLERIVMHFSTNNTMGAYWCKREMNIAIKEDNKLPYFFGGVSMTWNLPRMELEE